jgi:hypothetical protein
MKLQLCTMVLPSAQYIPPPAAPAVFAANVELTTKALPEL